MSDFLTIEELINRCKELNKIYDDNIKYMNIKTDKGKNELDVISFKCFKSNNVKIHELKFNNDLSFLNAFCYSLISKYQLLNIKQQEEYLEKIFITQILKDLRKKNGINKYITPTCALDKSIITSGFRQKKINDNHIKFLSIFFNINIFIIKKNVNTALTNTQEDYISILYTRNEYFNEFKHSIIIFNDEVNNLYYPLSINNKFIFIRNQDDIFKNYLEINKIFTEQQNKDNPYKSLSMGYDNDIENIEENKLNLLKDKDNKNKSIDTITSTTSITSSITSSISSYNIINNDINLDINKSINIKKENNDDIVINDKVDDIIFDDNNKDIKDNKYNKDNKDNNIENIDDKNNDNDENKENDEDEEDKDTTSNSIEEIKQENIKPNINNINIVSKTPDIIKSSNSPETEENTNTITTEQAILNVLEPQKIHKYTKNFLEQKPVVELKKLLKENGIKQSIRIDGKIKQKTRNEIIQDLLNVVD